MNKKRIKEISDFMYSSNSSKNVPFRISLTAGMSGFDLSKDELEDLLLFLENGDISRNGLDEFLRSIE